MWRRFNTWFAVICLTCFIGVQTANAAAVRAYSGKVNTATSGIIQHKLNKYGFAANDPRFGATISAASAGLTSVAGGAAAVAVGAATWPAVLVGAGIAAVVGGAIYLGQDLLVDWLWGEDGTVTLSGQGMGSADPSTLPLMPGTYPEVLAYGVGDWYFLVGSGSSAGSVRWFRNAECPGTTSSLCSKHRDTNFQELSSAPTGGVPYWSNRYRAKVGGAETYTVVFEFVNSPEPVAPPGYTPTPLTVEQAIEAVPAAAVDKELSPEMLAAIANATWKAQQGQNAVPWPASDPITAADVAEWLAANPTARPTVGDLFSPVSQVGDQAVPMPLPGTSVTPTPTPGEGDQIDLGDDPNTPPPTLEATPTAQMILDPILNLMPDLRTFSVPAHASECPRPEFEIFGTVHRWEVHCDLMEQNRALLEMAMLLVWSLCAVFIVLRA